MIEYTFEAQWKKCAKSTAVNLGLWQKFNEVCLSMKLMQMIIGNHRHHDLSYFSQNNEEMLIKIYECKNSKKNVKFKKKCKNSNKMSI